MKTAQDYFKTLAFSDLENYVQNGEARITDNFELVAETFGAEEESEELKKELMELYNDDIYYIIRESLK